MKYGHVFQLRSWSCFPSNAMVFLPTLQFFLRQPNPACFFPEHRGRTGTLLPAGTFRFAQASFPGPAHILFHMLWGSFASLSQPRLCFPSTLRPPSPQPITF